MTADRARGRTIALALLVLLLLAAEPALATRGPCVVGQERPRCQVWTGAVGAVYDGDSIRVDVDGDRTGRPAHVRLTGIQAMELTQYGRKRGRLGECNAVRATERLEELINAGGGRVRLAALHPDSTTGERRRLRRHVTVQASGQWLDVGAVLLDEGLALWLPNREEWAWNGLYSRLAARAAAAGVGLWDGDACGRGPSQTLLPLRMKVKWDAAGREAENVNGEWVRITNPDPVDPVSLAGWWFRDSHVRRYRFPAGAVIPPGLSIKLHVGRGADSPATFHWGLDGPIFDNATADHFQIGDGGYLFDPHGNLRAHVQYPCRAACREPLAGKLAVTAHRARGVIRLRNVSDEVVSLFEYELAHRNRFYEFPRDALLLPGQRLEVRKPHLLAADEGVVTLRNPAGAPVACHSWGGQCPAA